MPEDVLQRVNVQPGGCRLRLMCVLGRVNGRTVREAWGTDRSWVMRPCVRATLPINSRPRRTDVDTYGRMGRRYLGRLRPGAPTGGTRGRRGRLLGTKSRP